MQNKQELFTYFTGDAELQKQVLATISRENEPDILNIDGWSIKAITPGKERPSDNPLAYVHCVTHLHPDILWGDGAGSGIKMFIITKEALPAEEIIQAQSLGISCFTLDNSAELLTLLHDYLLEKFLEDAIIPEQNTPAKNVSSIPKLSGDLLKYAANIAIKNWANNSLRNLKSDARERLASFADATDDNCHALLTQVLLGKGDYGKITLNMVYVMTCNILKSI